MAVVGVNCFFFILVSLHLAAMQRKVKYFLFTKSFLNGRQCNNKKRKFMVRNTETKKIIRKY